MKLWLILSSIALAFVFGVAFAVMRAPKQSVADRLNQFGEAARNRFKADFERAGLAYPPGRITLVGLKKERLLQIYAGGTSGTIRFVRAYPILAASGSSGPKLREGDRQVPEGIYGVESLNPNSRYHVALRINYPNRFDHGQAARDGRTNLGGDIMIHGSAASVGCLAMGDEAAEDLFVLAADAGIENITVLLAPIDFRAEANQSLSAGAPSWTESLYSEIRSRLAELPLPNR